MRLDVTSLFSDAQVLSGASLDSANVLDIGKAGIAETQFFVVVRFLTEAAGVTSISLMGSDDESEWHNVVSADVTDLTEGGGVALRVPQGCPQFLKLVYKGSSMSGTVTAGFTLQTPSPRGKRIGDYEHNPQ